ncbi:histidyl-tRNA synthetase [Metamycoplasma subdolum]|uniref:Histidine--tRNA ligase n=1 Tax=Metamycoplasma subdolum TaxID=92407 RepID=A0A3M0A566_9BACT|nr:histidine--tRNA ligase [Metamycoplasma subdolum]RMA78649.1 histidyl-tRNA synthetase [Metamycoplasma subdolum]WPB50749.1 histidine--tRNA ligase [Metamycoplasma subdolum]
MFNKLKGTKDYYGLDAKILNYIKEKFFAIAKSFDFEFIDTPIIEEKSLFVRSVGETSDIVTKEMYTFKDNGGRDVALRPEATASVIRAFVENKINNLEDSKFYYFGPMFRYERPQKGRSRQFVQGGAELICKKSPLSNFEIIQMAYEFIKSLQINDFVLEINSLGSFESRNKYINVLKKYFEKYSDKLSEISKQRLEKNVLRILDDKEEIQKDFVKDAPKLFEFLTEQEKNEFNELTNLLNKFNIKYSINKNLVRGLDYYNDIVFEFVSTSPALGSQSTILAGGRYDGMIKSFEGPNLDSIGFAFGDARLIEIIKWQIDKYDELNDSLDILIAYLNEEEKDEILKITNLLRKKYRVKLLFEKVSTKELFKKFYKFNPKYLVFKELNSKENEIKIKTKENEVTLVLKDLKDFEKAIKKLE